MSDAPTPPPRASTTSTLQNLHFVSNITKNDVKTTSDFHTSTIRFTDGNDKAKLKLTLSTNQRKVSQPTSPPPCNGTAAKVTAPSVGRPSQESVRPRLAVRPNTDLPSYKGKILEVILICTFVIISILYLTVKQKVLEFMP